MRSAMAGWNAQSRATGMAIAPLVVEKGRRAVARPRHLAQLGEAVAVIVAARIALGDPSLALRRIEGAVAAPRHLVLVLETLEPLQAVIGDIVAGEIDHIRLGVAHFDQLGDRPLDAVGDERRLVETDRAAIDEELVRRQRLHADAAVA